MSLFLCVTVEQTFKKISGGHLICKILQMMFGQEIRMTTPNITLENYRCLRFQLGGKRTWQFLSHLAVTGGSPFTRHGFG